MNDKQWTYTGRIFTDMLCSKWSGGERMRLRRPNFGVRIYVVYDRASEKSRVSCQAFRSERKTVGRPPQNYETSSETTTVIRAERICGEDP